MFVITHKDRVIAGPTGWSRPFFTAMLERQGIKVEIPTSEPSEFPLVLNDETKAYKATLEFPEHNSKIEYLHGPFWTFEGGVATGTYQIMETPIELIKNALKERVAAVRYTKEIAGTKVTVQDTEVSVNTSREGKLIYSEKLAQMAEDDTINFKFKEGWLSLTKQNMQQIVSTINNHVQSTFDEEYQKVQSIESATTALELDAIVIGDEPIREQPPTE